MKLWPAAVLSIALAAPVFAADANLFQVFNYDRYNNGMEPNSNDLPGRLWVPAGPAPAGGYTLVTVFHGLGEVGSNYYNSTTQQFTSGYNTAQVNSNINALFAAAQQTGPNKGFIFYAPQAWGGWGGQNYDMAAAQMAKIMRTYDVDPTQVYVTGLSNGGRGTWEMATLYDDVFAAAVPICGQIHNEWNSAAANATVLSQLPIWAFHARNDGTVDVAATRQGVNLMRQAKGLSPIAYPSKNDGAYPAGYYTNGRNEYNDGLLRYTEYETGGHGIWSTAYARADLYDWMLSQTKHNPQQLQLGETLRFDFGATRTNTEGGKHWNSTIYGLGQTSGIAVAFAKTENDRRTAVTLDVSDTFQGDSTSQPPSLPAVGRDAWFVQSGSNSAGQITLTGLTPAGVYDLELFGSSTNAGITRYTINGVIRDLTVTNNLANTAFFDDMIASIEGTLTIDVSIFSGQYGYLNWLTVTAVPEPTALALLGPAVLVAFRRRK